MVKHFSITPSNIQIIEIIPLSQVSDSGKRLCVKLRMFEKTYHFMKSLCISCMIITMSLCSPCFPCFIEKKCKWRRANSGIFHIQPRTPLTRRSFWNSFLLQINECFLIREIKTSIVKLPVKLPSKPALSNHPHQHINNINNTLVTG